jgi:hypothetical protein
LVRGSALQWLIAAIAIAFAPHSLAAIPFGLVGLGLLAANYRSVLRKMAEPGRGRQQRMADFGPIVLSDQLRNSAILAAFSPITALVAFALIQYVARAGNELYLNRVVRGGIRQSMIGLRGEAEPYEEPARQEEPSV